MLNIIWLGLILASIFFGVINDRIPEVVNSVTTSAKAAFDIGLGLTGLLVLWLGIMQIAEDSGLINLFAKAIRPVMVRLFPDVPADDPAMGAMLMNIAANMLGIGNAATPFGLRAMAELERLNTTPGTASNAMCTFLAINTSSVQLIPTTAIAFLAAAGATNPTNVIITSLIATSFSTFVAIVAVRFFQNLPMFALRQQEVVE